MRISDALAKARPIVVEFEGESLNVTYRPSSYTVAELESLVEEDGTGQKRANPQRIVEMMQQMLVKWDLTEDDGVPVDFTNTERMRHIPTPIFMGILTAIKADQSAGEASSPSAAS